MQMKTNKNYIKSNGRYDIAFVLVNINEGRKGVSQKRVYKDLYRYPSPHQQQQDENANLVKLKLKNRSVSK